MFSRNSIFAQNNPATTNNATPHFKQNSYSNNQNFQMTQSYAMNQSNNPMNQSNNQSLQQKVGSNRLQYQHDRIPQSLKGLLPQWKEDFMPASITCRIETLHLSGMEFRLEDYYLIRNKKLSSYFQNKLVEVINYSSFNKQLLDKPVQLQSYSKQPCLSEEMIVRERNRFAQPNSMNNSANRMGVANGVNNSNSSMFGGQTNAASNNLLSNNRANNPPSIFGNNNANTTSTYGNGSSGHGSNYQKGGSSSGGNIFTNNSSTNNNNSSNVFMRNSTSSNAQGNTAGNLFNNNNNSTTMFSNSSNNPTNTQAISDNIFVNRTNNATNNTNSTPSNNIFNNNTSNNNLFNNNTSGGNVFNNSSTNTNRNTLFNNNGSNNNYAANTNQLASNAQQQPNVDIGYLMQSFQSYLQNTQTYLQYLKTQNSLRQKQKEQEQKQSKIEKKDVWSKMRETQQYNHQKQEFYQQERRFNLSKKRDDDDCMVLIFRKPKEILQVQKAQQLFHQQSQNIPENQGYNQSKSIKNQTLQRNPSPKIHQTNLNKSVRMTNLLPNKSIKISNYPRDEFNSMIYSRCDLTVNHTKTRESKLFLDEPCSCDVNLQIFWQECESRDDKIEVKLPTIRTFSIEVPRFDMETENGRKEFENELKKQPFVKADAKFIPDRRKIEIDQYNAHIKLSGRLEQKIINIDLEQKRKSTKIIISIPRYSVQYSKITDTHIYNLAIYRKDKGTIVWQQPVPFETLDFKKDNLFFIEDYEIGCELPELQGPCIVTFETLPRQIERVLKSTGIVQAKYNLQKMLQKMSKDIEFGELWENGTWCFKLKKGFDK